MDDENNAEIKRLTRQLIHQVIGTTLICGSIMGFIGWYLFPILEDHLGEVGAFVGTQAIVLPMLCFAEFKIILRLGRHHQEQINSIKKEKH